MFSSQMAPQVSDGPRRLPLLSNMILYLLFPALIIGVVDSQTVNRTEGAFGNVEVNQTFTVSTNNHSVTQPENVTRSLDTDKLNEFRDELQNKTVITEDDESFQDQEEIAPDGLKHCYEDGLLIYSREICGNDFYNVMLNITEDWCVLENIIRPYNVMTECLEEISSMLGCYYPHPRIQEFFLEIHSHYFYNCTEEETPFTDAPHGLVVALTLIPVSLIPILVYRVVWNSKVQR